MKKNKTSKKLLSQREDEEDLFPDYTIYPADDDIYSKYKEEDLDPEFLLGAGKQGSQLKKKFKLDLNDLDIPGSELDDEQEEIGNEDEENNYYSLGGEEHSDLDEDNS